MNIHENTALLDAFVDGELTSEEMISVQSHLDECPECRAYVDDVLVIRASFPTEDNAELPADFAETVMKAVAETPQSRPKKRQPWGMWNKSGAWPGIPVRALSFWDGSGRDAKRPFV